MSEPPLAEVLVKFVVAGVTFMVLVGFMADLCLGLTGRETASVWLRRPENAAWFWEPAWAALVLLLWLAVHLFYLPPRWRP